MLPGYPESAICVQRFDDSLNSAIHITYRNWLRSSSMHEPRDPPLEVVKCFLQFNVRRQRSTGITSVLKIHTIVRTWGPIEISLKRSVLPERYPTRSLQFTVVLSSDKR